MILESPGDDLGSRRTSSVGQQDQRDCRSNRVVAGDEGLVLPVAGADARDLLPFLEEQIAHAQRLIEDAAGVSAQVYHDTPCPLTRQPGDRVREEVEPDGFRDSVVRLVLVGAGGEGLHQRADARDAAVSTSSTPDQERDPCT